LLFMSYKPKRSPWIFFILVTPIVKIFVVLSEPKHVKKKTIITHSSRLRERLVTMNKIKSFKFGMDINRLKNK